MGREGLPYINSSVFSATRSTKWCWRCRLRGCRARLARDRLRAGGGGRDFANNFQIWLNHGRVLSDSFLSTLVARQLALRLGGDHGSCDWLHFGRLAGFTNQKKERRLDNGLQPFVKPRCCQGRVYSRAAEFLCDLQAHRQKIRPQRELRETVLPRDSGPSVRSISSFHDDPRYGGDLHRAQTWHGRYTPQTGVFRKNRSRTKSSAVAISRKRVAVHGSSITRREPRGRRSPGQ